MLSIFFRPYTKHFECFTSWASCRYLFLLDLNHFLKKLTFYLVLCMTTINAVFPCFTNISPFIITKFHRDGKVSSLLQMWPKTTQLRLHQTLELNQRLKVPAQCLPVKSILINPCGLPF